MFAPTKSRWPELSLIAAILCTWGYAWFRHGWGVFAIAIIVSFVWLGITLVLLVRPPGFPRIDLSGDPGEEQVVTREELFAKPQLDWRPKICLAVAASATIALMISLEAAL